MGGGAAYRRYNLVGNCSGRVLPPSSLPLHLALAPTHSSRPAAGHALCAMQHLAVVDQKGSWPVGHEVEEMAELGFGRVELKATLPGTAVGKEGDLSGQGGNTCLCGPHTSAGIQHVFLLCRHHPWLTAQCRAASFP